MTPLALLASLIILGYTAYYALACAEFPYGPCRIHTGTRCPRCAGTGRRVRIGRRVYEYLRSEYRRGTR